MPILSQRIGFIGSGQMATALTQGFVQAGLTNAETILASDPDANARARFTTNTGGKAVESNLDVVNAADVLFLAVKPQYMASVLQPLSGKIPARTLVISIAAGIKIPQLTGWLGKDVRLVRVMPNTPCFVGQGACGFCSGEKTTPQDVELVKQLLSAVGIAWQVEERLMDAVTGLSGSGPAFIYILIEAMADAGVRVGLPRAIASALAAQTVRGAAEMVLKTHEHPAVLKDRVASPGGTTIAGIKALEEGAFRATIIDAVEAATLRSQELGN